MDSTTIDHDCCIEDNVVLSSHTVLGGNVTLMNNTQLGIRTSVHQNQIIGSYSMIGMDSVITKKLVVRPGYIYYGKPAKKIKNCAKVTLKQMRDHYALACASPTMMKRIYRRCSDHGLSEKPSTAVATRPRLSRSTGRCVVLALCWPALRIHSRQDLWDLLPWLSVCVFFAGLLVPAGGAPARTWTGCGPSSPPSI